MRRTQGPAKAAHPKSRAKLHGPRRPQADPRQSNGREGGTRPQGGPFPSTPDNVLATLAEILTTLANGLITNGTNNKADRELSETCSTQCLLHALGSPE